MTTSVYVYFEREKFQMIIINNLFWYLKLLIILI